MEDEITEHFATACLPAQLRPEVEGYLQLQTTKVKN